MQLQLHKCHKDCSALFPCKFSMKEGSDHQLGTSKKKILNRRGYADIFHLEEATFGFPIEKALRA